MDQTHNLYSITIGVTTYVVGRNCPKPIGADNTEDAPVSLLNVAWVTGMVSVEFEDGDIIATHISNALLRYTPIPEPPLVEPAPETELAPIETPKPKRRRRKAKKRTAK